MPTINWVDEPVDEPVRAPMLSPLARQKQQQMTEADWDQLHERTRHLPQFGEITTPSDMTVDIADMVDNMTDELLLDAFKPLPSVDVDDRSSLKQLPLDPAVFFFTRKRNPSNYTLLIRAHAAQQKVKEGLHVFESMLEAKVDRERHSYIAVLGLIGSQAKKKSPKKSTSYHPSRYRRFVELAQHYWEKMETDGIKPNVQAYGAMINTMGVLEHPDEAFKLFETMKTVDFIIPNEVIYTSLIVGCWKAGQAERAEETYKEMFEHGYLGDPLTYNTLIRVSAEHGNCEGAMGWWQKMQHFDIEASLYTFTNLIYACSQRPDYHTKAFEYYEICLGRGHTPNNRLMDVVLNACAKRGDISAAQRIWQQFTEFNLKPDIISYNTFIWTIAKKMAVQEWRSGTDVWSREDRLMLADDLFKEVCARSDMTPDRRTLNNMLAVYTNGKMTEQAAGMFLNAYEKFGELPDYWSHMHMITMHCRVQDLTEAFKYFALMKSKDIKPSQHTFATLLKCCNRNQDAFAGAAVLREMMIAGHRACKYDAFPFAHLINDKDIAPEKRIKVRYEVMSETAFIKPRQKRALKEAEQLREELLAEAPSKQSAEWKKQNWGNDVKYHPLNPRFAENIVNQNAKGQDIDYERSRNHMNRRRLQMSRMKRYKE